MNIKNLIITGLCVPLDKNRAINHPNHKTGLPMCFVGEPGVGKSEIIEELGEELRMLTHTIFIPSKNPEDIGGYPVQDGTGKLVRMCDDPVIHSLAEVQEGLVLLDEINTNRQQIYAALLSVLLRRTYGGVSLGGRVRFVAAMNPIESSVGGIEFPAPIANRFMHCRWPSPSATSWSDWILDYEEDRVEVKAMSVYEKQRDENWDGAWSDIAGKGAGFMKVRGSLLHKRPEVGTPDFSSAWPSHRTWWWALRSMATTKALSMGEEVRVALLSGCVGAAAASEFLAWERAADLPTAEDMLKNGWKPDKTRLDRCIAAYSTLTTHVLSLKNKEQIAAAAKTWAIFHDACKSGPLADIITRPARLLVLRNLGLSSGVDDIIKYAEPVLERIQPLNARAKAVEQVQA